jgi:cell wall-associated NlpC family hydrolase
MARYAAEQIYAFARAAGFSPDQAVTMTAIALAESGGNSGAHNASGEDSRGLWQINMRAHESWAGQLDLYDPLDNARAAYRISLGGADISPWTTAHGSDAPYRSFQDEAQAAAVSHGDPSGLGVWTGTAGYGHPVPAGDGGGPGLLFGGETPGGGGAVQTFLDAALAQTGDRYVLGAEADPDDKNPSVFDCSELTQWAAHQAGVELPDGTWLQYLELKEQGAIIPVEEAVRTPGALLFSFSTEPTPGGGRPSHAHVAISLGDGKTIEARGRSYGVGSFEASSERFQYAAVVPGLASGGGLTEPDSVLDLDAPDTDHDGLTDALEQRLHLNPTMVDSDADGLSDGYELLRLHTNPGSADTDHDQISDAIELTLGTDPLAADTDRDGQVDGSVGPPGADADGDTLSDNLERILGSRADRVDSDGDGFTDALEHQGGYDLLDPLSNPLSATAAHSGWGDPVDPGGGVGDDTPWHAEPPDDDPA